MEPRTTLCALLDHQVDRHPENVDRELDLRGRYDTFVVHRERRPAEVEGYRKRNVVGVSLAIRNGDIATWTGGRARQLSSFRLEGEIDGNITIRLRRCPKPERGSPC